MPYVKSGAHDFYLIDGACDTKIELGKSLSRLIKELYPSSHIIGVSAVGSYLDNPNQTFDQRIDIHFLSRPKDFVRVFVAGCFIPEKPELLQQMREEAFRKHHGINPLVARLLEDDE